MKWNQKKIMKWKMTPSEILDLKRSALITGLSGKIGDLVFKQVNGKQVVARLPKYKRKLPTAVQAAQRKRFAEAARQARELLQDPLQSEYYNRMSLTKHVPGYSLLIGELLRGEAPRDVAAEVEARRQADEARREERRRRAEQERYLREVAQPKRPRPIQPSPDTLRPLVAQRSDPNHVECLLEQIRKLDPMHLHRLKMRLEEMCRASGAGDRDMAARS
jgi:hypothetical protein